MSTYHLPGHTLCLRVLVIGFSAGEQATVQIVKQHLMHSHTLTYAMQSNYINIEWL
jgi:hypothetical protein